MLRGIILDTKWSHQQNLAYIGPPKNLGRTRKNPRKPKNVTGKLSIEEMREIEYQAFGRLLF